MVLHLWVIWGVCLDHCDATLICVRRNGNSLSRAALTLQIQSDPAISNAQRKQKLVRCSEGSLYPNVLKTNQINGNWKTVRYSGDLLYPVFNIAEFACII